MDHRTIKSALQAIVEHYPEKKYLEVLDIMDKLEVGDYRKKEIAKMYGIFQGNLPESVIKSIFEINFFYVPL